MKLKVRRIAKNDILKSLIGVVSCLFMFLLPLTLSAKQIDFPDANNIETCKGEFCTILSVTEERGRVLQQYDRYASLIKVPVEDGKLKLVQGVNHVDYMSVGCRKEFAIPKKIYAPISRILASFNKQAPDASGAPATLAAPQMAMLAFYASVLKQGEYLECPFPELFRNGLPDNE